jgi:hypothetical protein
VIWEIVFMMVILKIPIAYMCVVVWWAIKAEPEPLEGAAVTASLGPDGPAGRFRRASRPLRRGPARGPVRGPAPTARTALSRAEARR